jgi:hypothetical protein
MHSSRYLWLAAACALAALLIAPAAAGAKTTAHLRVEATGGKVLADVTEPMSPATVKTDPGADCFGAPGGSGDRVRIPDDTALGLLADALPDVPALRPLSITDQFSFGLAICGIGGKVASGDGFWYLKRNHVASQVGGDQLKVHDGDQILWYLAPGFPVGDELALKAPRRARPGVPVRVKVVAYTDKGKRHAAKGVDLGHGAKPTDAAGVTQVTFPRAGTRKLQARHAGDIPSNVATVCVEADASKCAARGG